MSRRADDCPFCGGHAKVWMRTSFDYRVNKETRRTTVLCTSCGCRTQAFARPEDAIASWNRRCAVAKVAGHRPWWRRILGV